MTGPSASASFSPSSKKIMASPPMTTPLTPTSSKMNPLKKKYTPSVSLVPSYLHSHAHIFTVTKYRTHISDKEALKAQHQKNRKQWNLRMSSGKTSAAYPRNMQENWWHPRESAKICNACWNLKGGKGKDGENIRNFPKSEKDFNCSRIRLGCVADMGK